MPSRFSSFRFSPLLKRQSSSSSPSRRTVEKESRESSSSEERKDRRERRGRRAGAGGDFEGEEEEEELVAGVGVPERSGKGGPRHARKKVLSSNSNKNNKNNSSSNSSSSCSVNDEDDGDKKKKKKKSAHNTKSKTKKKQSAKQVKKGIGRRRGTQGEVETGDVAKKNRRLSLKLASKKKGGGVGGQHDRVHAELDELYDSAELDEEEANLGSHDSSDGGFYSDSYSDAFVGSFDLVDDNHDGSSDFAILSPVEIAQEQRREVTKVAETLSVSRDDATALLKHFRWKREQLLTAYFEDPESVRTDAGVTGDIVFVEASRSNISATSSQSTLSSPRSSVDDGDDDEGHHHHHGPDLSVLKQRVAGEGSSASTLGAVSGAVLLVGEEECSICGDEMPAEECTALICQHRFCNDCWEGYLNVKIREGETTLLCPAENCRLACDEDTVRKLLEPDVFDRYIEFLTKSFVDDNVGTIKWCPAPNCGNAITSDLVSGQVVRCTCGFRFCFSCHKEAHAPASCDQVKVWEKKCEDDSETDHWKIANTKECPKNGCQVSTEKNGGCNHMTCRQCKHEWCWVCMRPWKGHNDYYNCNKFTKDEAKAASATTKFGIFGRKSKQAKRLEREAEREATRVELERYLHFYERFANHSHSRDLEQQIRSRAVGKIDELAEAASQAELQYIEDGTDVLLECRNVLKYTYVFAYFLPVEGPEKELFEYLQEDLEKTTESLSEILEHPDGSQVYRLRAVNMIQLARTRVSNLLRGVEQGLTEVSEH